MRDDVHVAPAALEGAGLVNGSAAGSLEDVVDGPDRALDRAGRRQAGRVRESRRVRLWAVEPGEDGEEVGSGRAQQAFGVAELLLDGVPLAEHGRAAHRRLAGRQGLELLDGGSGNAEG